LARNLKEAEELTALAKEKGVRTMVGLQARQSPSILKAKEIVASGKLGKILGTTMFGHVSLSQFLPPGSNEKKWYMQIMWFTNKSN
jgi:predicted dehydrogenase